jgi:hypothetical protein
VLIRRRVGRHDAKNRGFTCFRLIGVHGHCRLSAFKFVGAMWYKIHRIVSLLGPKFGAMLTV